ncbi:MAG TPA: hypothetical protein V6D17_04190 [Candidatus Obscuribacterales bacterium]
MSKVLITINEDRSLTTENTFGVTYKVDEHDCLDYARGLASLGSEVYFVNWQDFDGHQFARMFHHNGRRFLSPPMPLEEMDLIWVYQMEGFYFDLPRFFQMVERFKAACPLVINDPATIRHNTDKMYLIELQEAGAGVIPTRQCDDVFRERLSRGERFVLKPRYGERGRGVILVKSLNDVEQISGKEEQYLAQDFMPSIRHGEKSLVFLGLEYHHAVLKRPCPSNPDEFRCNESRGGTVAVYEPTAAELDYARNVLKTYEAFGCPVNYSRIDFVDSANGPALIEAELLNPAAFANYSKKGPQFGVKVAEYMHRKMKQAGVRASRR